MTNFDRCGDPLAERRIAYAEALLRAGDADAGAQVMEQALELVPGFAAGHARLGEMLEEAGRAGDAADAYRAALRLDPADRTGSGLRLARLGALPMPDTAPAAFVASLFDQYAGRFEAQLVGKLDYRAPDALRDALMTADGDGMRFAETLDLGCGTGLMGEKLRDCSSRLSGIDLSPAMLAVARRKGIYDRLETGDIAAYRRSGAAFDLVTAADVLLYVGDLGPVIANVASLTSPGALFAFTLERHDGPQDYVLGASLRFAHSRRYAVAILASHGFAIKLERELVLRTDRGEPVGGLLFVAAREPDTPG